MMLFLAASLVDAFPTLDSIKSVRTLSVEKASEGRPVELEAQVVWVNSHRGTFFLYDGENGIFVQGPEESAEAKSLKAGDVVQVKGVTTTGGFAPDIDAHHITVLGHEPRHEADSLTEHQRLSPVFDADWIKTRGRLISMTVRWNMKSISLEVSRNDLLLNIQMPYSESNEVRLTELMFEFVEFSAVCGTVYNPQRQAVGRIYYANSPDDFIAVDLSQNTAPAKLMQVHELYRYGISSRREVKTHGVVTYLGPREMYLRGEQAALKVAVSTRPDVEVGDEVMVQGVVSPQPVTPAFRARSVEVIGKKDRPLPVRIEANDQIDVSLNYDLIELDAVLVERGKAFWGADGVAQQILLCRFFDQLFEVFFPAGASLSDDLKPGAKLRLTGICNVTRNQNLSWYFQVDGFSLALRSMDDIEVLVKSPWWTMGRLLILLGGMVSVAVLALIWGVVLHRTVERQTAVIAAKVEREAIHEERQRIAREMHDTLAQGLVGMGIQLKSRIRKMELNKKELFAFFKKFDVPDQALGPVLEKIENITSEERKSLDDLLDKMERCSEESRSSILYLRSGMAGRMGLLTAMQEVLEPLADETGVLLSIKLEGQARALKQEIERNLMLTTKEAVTNAVRHSETERIKVVLRFTKEGLQIKVKDDGCGFDADGIQKKGHYGLQGMRERMKQFGGVLEINSEKGKGTEILISMDSTAAWEV
ncbi:Sensor histidine kinase LiaS [Pontiella sulfatireligans]|uniref:Sensor histidine kinase LiaS n=2 Tax=Pontiella sulfatireligans TaxID=2750658 RepID=A0A6C2UQ75_9BACT|nr:Sensor histidine kinase LiaS [Pontiella sulfatireligans]